MKEIKVSQLSLDAQIRSIRHYRGMTVEGLMEKANVSKSCITHLNQAKDIKLFTLQKIADALGCELSITLTPKEGWDK